MSGKRPQRERRATNKETNAPDSSPSRPSKRRRITQVEAEASPDPVESLPLPLDRAGMDMNDDQLVQQLSRTLKIPQYPVNVASDHANGLHQDSSTVEAFAKLAGNEWTFYIKDIKNYIGRKPADLAPDEAPQFGKFPIHIDLGPNKTVSRYHGLIFFNNDLQRWQIGVNGRNGMKINGATLRKDEQMDLVSGQIIEIGGVEMVFVLPHPDGKPRSLNIDKLWLRRAGLIQQAPAGDETASDEGADGSTRHGRFPDYTAPNSAGNLAIAPAPPNYQRPATPASAQSREYQPMIGGRSPYASGTMVMHSDDIDLSLEGNRHIKPAYSYAQIISQAIFSGEDERMTLSGIYQFIQDRYAFYRTQNPSGWQNSIRHNLSLNKSFIKVARTTDEPGKGMKWMIKAEHRDEMLRNSTRGGRGGIRSSSAPSSPVIPGYVNRSYTHMPSGDPGSSAKRSPQSDSPPSHSYPSNGPHFTPNRGGQLLTSLQDNNTPGDGSPLPRHKRGLGNAFGLSDNAPRSPPPMSSSYQQEDNNSFVTPAPHRVHPRLAPPSTAQRPSQVMPTSSPAPFWKFADEITPMKGSFDSSPTKGSTMNSTIVQSSSPAPVHASPTRTGAVINRVPKLEEEVEDEDIGFDLTKGFQSIGAYHGSNAPSAGLNGRS